MPEAVFDFADIRSRMLGANKSPPKLKVERPICLTCSNSGWVNVYHMVTMTSSKAECHVCGNPEAKPCP